MNDTMENQERTSGELVAFAAAFAGVVTAAAGIVTACLPGALLGAALLGMAVIFFGLRQL